MEQLPSLVSAFFSNPLLYIVTLTLALILVITGKIKVHGKLVTIGNESEKERDIIRNQIEYARVFCLGLQRFIKDPNKYRELFVIEQIFNEVVNIISFNHLRDEEDYILVKQEKMWNIASTTVDDELYQTDEFKKVIFERGAKLVKELCKIRKLRS